MKDTNISDNGLLSLLTPARRRKLHREVIDLIVGDFAASKTVGDLIKKYEKVRRLPISEDIKTVSIAKMLHVGAKGKHLPHTAEDHKPHRRRNVAAKIPAVLDVVKKYPGKTTSELHALSHMHRSTWDAGLAKARLEKLVKTTGKRRQATYRIAKSA